MLTDGEVLARAIQQIEAGNQAVAEQLLSSILESNPRQPDALQLLGVVHARAGRFNRAAELLEQAIESAPGIAAHHSNLACVYHALGRFAEAEAQCRKAVAMNPTDVGARYNLALALQSQCKLEESVTAYKLVLRLEPNHAAASNNLGNIRRNQGRLVDAEAHYRLALSMAPHDPAIQNNLGVTLLEQGRAADAAACFEQAIELRPDFGEAYLNLGNVWQGRQRPGQAASYYRQAVQALPTSAEAHFSLGQALMQLGDIPEAWAHLDQSLLISPTPERRLAASLLLPPVYQSTTDILFWRRRLHENVRSFQAEPITFEPTADAVKMPFFLAYHGLNDRELQRDLATLYRHACPQLNFTAPHCQPGKRRTANRQIRIGFVSRFFQPQHSTALYYAGLIRELARTDLRVIVVGFAGSDDDLTYAMQPDKSAVVRLPLSRVPHTLFPALAEQEFDVLVYPDVGMDPWTYILASARLAPVQCALAGHPVTTGLPTIDYFLSSFDLEPTDAESHYSEQLVRFKQVLNYFERPKLSTPLRHRSDFGLPEDAHLFLCPQSLFKIHPAFDSLVGALLQADPQALVVLFGSPSTHWNELVAERLARSLPDVVERVRFLPWQPYEDYLHLLRLADAVLDPPHFGGGVTTFQALGVGAPVVTLPGAFSRSRMAYACYRRMDLSECIAADEDEYVRIAVRLASDQTWREAVQFKIQAAGPKIFENLEAVEEVGQFFRRVVAQALETQESA